MNEDLQRVMIARECGWKDVELRLYNEGTGMDSYIWTSGILGQGGREIPDYPRDLNAMHEAEQYLHEKNPTQYWFYADIALKSVVWKNGAPGVAYQCASAAQRAEAFLRAVSKWEGAPL